VQRYEMQWTSWKAKVSELAKVSLSLRCSTDLKIGFHALAAEERNGSGTGRLLFLHK